MFVLFAFGKVRDVHTVLKAGREQLLVVNAVFRLVDGHNFEALRLHVLFGGFLMITIV